MFDSDKTNRDMRNLKFIFLLIFLAASAVSKANDDALDIKVVGEGKPMILIPGLTCHGDVWEATVEKYKDSYQCHVFTLPGFAGNEAVDFGDSYLETIKSLIMDYVGKNKLKDPVIVGHSLGGHLALSLAKDNPGAFSKLVIVDGLPFLGAIMMPGATAESVKPMAENMKNMMLNMTAETAETNQKAMLQTMITDPSNIEIAYQWGASSDINTVAQAMYELYTTDIREDLAKIDVPILVMGAWIAYKNYGATRESTLNNYTSQFTHANNYEVVLTDKGKHFIMWDDPEFFFTEMDKFL